MIIEKTTLNIIKTTNLEKRGTNGVIKSDKGNKKELPRYYH